MIVQETVISWRGALDWPHIAGFLGRRAIPAIESVGADQYVRGAVRVRREPKRRRFVVSGTTADAARVRRLFDVDADTSRIELHLSRDRTLAPLVQKHRGIRVPGGWDPFEIVVRAIVGQQISVSAARTLLGTLVDRYGDGSFPTAGRLAAAPLQLGMPKRRLESLREVARAVNSGFLLQRRTTLDETIAALDALPGVGPWTANHIAMRALGETDAFPAGDLVLRRNAGNLTEVQLLKRAETWRPFRAYAAMLLWAV